MENMEEVKEVVTEATEQTTEIIAPTVTEVAAKVGNNTLKTIGKIGLGVGGVGVLGGALYLGYRKWIKPALAKRKNRKAEKAVKGKKSAAKEPKEQPELDPNDIPEEELNINE